MEVRLHKLARTTPLIRREIRDSSETIAVLAERYQVSHSTISKWKHRDNEQDLSHKRHNILSSLSEAEESLVVGLRKDIGLNLDDITHVMQHSVNDKLSRSAIYRCLKRYGVSGRPKAAPAVKHQPFEIVNTPGFIHMDVKYLTVLQGKRSYVYVAIDRATRYVYAEILYDLKPATTVGFIERFIKDFPCPVRIILTDNGMEWTDRCNNKVKPKATGNHPVDRLCHKHDIEHRLTKPRHPQTNGMVERFNRRINEAIARKTKISDNQGKNSFHSHNERNSYITNFVDNYNNTRLQCIEYNTPKMILHNHTEQYTCAGMTAGEIQDRRYRRCQGIGDCTSSLG